MAKVFQPYQKLRVTAELNLPGNSADAMRASGERHDMLTRAMKAIGFTSIDIQVSQFNKRVPEAERVTELPRLPSLSELDQAMAAAVAEVANGDKAK